MGKPDQLLKARGRGRPAKTKSGEQAQRTGFEGSTHAPWRKTVSIFKQPVTQVSTAKKESKVITDENPLMKRKPSKRNEARPFQAMWAKSLSGVTALVPLEMADKTTDAEKAEFISENLHLAGRLRRAIDVIDEQAAAATICHVLNNPVNNGAFGQVAEKPALEQNFVANMTPDQPLIEKIAIGQLGEEILAQEKRVLDYRKRLQEVMKFFG